MKNNSFKELKVKSIADLELELRTRREALQQMRFDLASGKVKNVFAIRLAKKNIARILTLLRKVATGKV